jgi:Icc-related predicted phosphoesterase
VILVFLSDTHGYHSRITVPPGDALVFAGDYSSRGDLDDTVSFLSWFTQQPHRDKVLISGNHDRISCVQPTLFRELLAEHAPDVVYLQDSGVEIGGLRFWGSPYTPTFLSWYHMRERGAAIRAHWDLIPDNTDVLVTHGPPFGYLDAVDNGRNRAGDRDLYEAILRVRPRVSCHGHLHLEGGQSTTLVHDDGTKTIIINAAICDEGYRPCRQPIILDL